MSRSAPSIAIAGAGIVGLSLAWRLAQAGFSVSVYDQGRAGAEASWAGAGMLAPGGEFDEDSALSRLALESRALYPGFVRELERAAEMPIDLQQTGAIDLAFSDRELIGLAARVEKQQLLGIEAKRLDPARIKAFWPRVRTENLAGGYFYPGDGVVNPREVVIALRRAAEKAGVDVLENCPAREATVEPQSVVVKTPLGDPKHDVFVIAAGAWSSSIPLRGVVPVPAAEPVRGHLVGYRQPEQTCQTIVRQGHTYLLQRANGLLIAGASVERAGFDRSVDESAVGELRRQAEFVMPHLSETSPIEAWNGFRPSSDALQIGQWQSSPVYLAYGHYRNGILLAPVTAKLLSEEITANLQKR